jgi:hypothetical protein
MSRLLHVRQIGLPPVIKGRWDANENGIDALQLGKIRRGDELFAVDVLSNFLGGNVLDVALARIQLFDLDRIRIKAPNTVPAPGKSQEQGQSHIAAPHDADFEIRPLKVLR